MKTEFELARARRQSREHKREAAPPPLHLVRNDQQEREEAVEPEPEPPRLAGFSGETDDGVQFE